MKLFEVWLENAYCGLYEAQDEKQALDAHFGEYPGYISYEQKIITQGGESFVSATEYLPGEFK